MASNENNHDNITINWNNIINHDTRSIDDADLGKVQGLFEPFVVTEKPTQKQKITETTTNDGNDATTKKGKRNR